MAEMSIQNPAQAAVIAERARQYLAEFGPELPGNRETGILGTTPEEEAAFEDFANQAACPALDPATGLCDVYEARPMTCRIFGPPVRMNPAPSGNPAGTTFSMNRNPSEELRRPRRLRAVCFTQATQEESAAAEMTVPWAEEQVILDQLEPGNTIVAYCLTLPQLPQPEPA